MQYLEDLKWVELATKFSGTTKIYKVLFLFSLWIISLLHFAVGAGIFERDSVASGVLSPGFRSMAVSSDGKHLAAGDCLGNIHILNLCTYDYSCILVSLSPLNCFFNICFWNYCIDNLI